MNYKDKKLFPHQVDFMEKRDGKSYYLVWPTGGGKSMCIAFKMEWLKEKVYGGEFPLVLYICPKSCMKQVADTFVEMTSLNSHQVAVIGPSFFKERSNWRTNFPKSLKVGIISSDFMLHAFTKKTFASECNKGFLSIFRPQVLIVDEMHMFKKAEDEAKRYFKTSEYGVKTEHYATKPSRASLLRKYSRMCPSIDYRYGLSATGSPKNYMDFWSQYYVLDQGERLGILDEYKKLFSSVIKLYNKAQKIEYKALEGTREAIFEKIADITLRCTEDEINKAHGKTVIPTPRDFKYTKPKCEKAHEYEKIVLTSQSYQPATKLLKCHQIVNGFLVRDERKLLLSGKFEEIKEVVRIPCWKYEATAEMVAEFKARGEQCIVWTVYEEQVELMKEALDKACLSYGVITGKKTAKHRDAVIESAKIGEINAIISNVAAGGTGLNLQFINNSVWLTQTYNFKDMRQSVGRNKRPGFDTSKTLRHIYLITENSVEDRIIRNVKTKSELDKAFKTYLYKRTVKLIKKP